MVPRPIINGDGLKSYILIETDAVAEVIKDIGTPVIEAVGAAVVVAGAVVPVAFGVIGGLVVPVVSGTDVITVVVPDVPGTMVDVGVVVIVTVFDVHPANRTAVMTTIANTAPYTREDRLIICFTILKPL